MSWDGDEIVVAEQATYGEDGISRIAPDEHGQYMVNGWRWPWTVVDPADCDRIIGRPPTAGEQPALVMLPHSGLRVPHTRLAVTAIAVPHVGLADALAAILRLDDTLVGIAETDGRQPLVYRSVRGSRFGRERLAELAACCRRRGQPVTVDEFLRCLVEEYDLTVRAHHAAGRGDTLVRLTDPDGHILMIKSVSAPADARDRAHSRKCSFSSRHRPTASSGRSGLLWAGRFSPGSMAAEQPHSRCPCPLPSGAARPIPPTLDREQIVIETELVLKYCGQQIDPQALTDAVFADTSQPTVASELWDAINELRSTERSITGLVPTLEQSLRDVNQVLAAKHDDRIPLIDMTGVLQARGPRLDALLGRRAAQIDRLRSLTRLWVAQHPGPVTNPPH
ncbi:hypothetical protein GCM10027290_30010 [Micromonospora sonneratiae]|uniref:Uncharacterized protein n=1 Tax=Micromonospora sonneratiae TaxID=1184706 RepID=A0ABW3YGD0_9ACTN